MKTINEIIISVFIENIMKDNGTGITSEEDEKPQLRMTELN